jgi:hypothetical protein
MNLFRKSLISFAGVAAAALLLAFTSTRTMHALGPLGAELVRITNSAEAPAIVEDVPHFASHLVTLYGYVASTSYGDPFEQQTPAGTVLENAFVVPDGQSFIITGIDITPNSNTPSWINIQNYDGGWYGGWTVPGNAGFTTTTEYQYPSGIVVGSGATLAIFGSNVGTLVMVHGYLTPN